MITEKEGSFKFNVLNKDGDYEPWTGPFKDKSKAMIWFNKHGKFHTDRGFKLGLFRKRILLKTFEK